MDVKRSADTRLLDSVNHALLRIWCVAPSSWFKKEVVDVLDDGLTAIETNADSATEKIAACACPAWENAAIYAKRLAKLLAQFALLSYMQYPSRLNDGSYVATRWGMARPLPTLDAAEAFLVQVGGGRHEL
ncbi:MAG: hypothetical protein ABIR13_03805 [Polaromonas sp.]